MNAVSPDLVQNSHSRALPNRARSTGRSNLCFTSLLIPLVLSAICLSYQVAVYGSCIRDCRRFNNVARAAEAMVSDTVLDELHGHLLCE